MSASSSRRHVNDNPPRLHKLDAQRAAEPQVVHGDGALQSSWLNPVLADASIHLGNSNVIAQGVASARKPPRAGGSSTTTSSVWPDSRAVGRGLRAEAGRRGCVRPSSRRAPTLRAALRARERRPGHGAPSPGLQIAARDACKTSDRGRCATRIPISTTRFNRDPQSWFRAGSLDSSARCASMTRGPIVLLLRTPRPRALSRGRAGGARSGDKA